MRRVIIQHRRGPETSASSIGGREPTQSNLARPPEPEGRPCVVDANETERSHVECLSNRPDGIPIHVQPRILWSPCGRIPRSRRRGPERRPPAASSSSSSPRVRANRNTSWASACFTNETSSGQAKGLDNAGNAVDDGDCCARLDASLLRHRLVRHGTPPVNAPRDDQVCRTLRFSGGALRRAVATGC